ncbi:MAG: hypothetical protein KKB50_18965 [Planctomycetes bacterium]|nr:hypothetical protein [Planctomycetota bacterium]
MQSISRLLLGGLVCLLLAGCPVVNPGGWNGDGGSPDGSGTAPSGDVSASALNYQGTLTGAVATTSSTAGSDSGQAARGVPFSAYTSSAMAYLTDTDGSPLLDATGNEYPPFPVDPTGSFELVGLPVGVDIVVHIDMDGDGEPDLATIVNIPKDSAANAGALADVTIDPLSTLVHAKLKRMLQEQGVTGEKLKLSLSGLIERIRDAYENLLDDAGIENDIALDAILGLSPEEMAALFEQLVPSGAQRGMRMAESNIALAVAEDVEAVVKAVAKTMVEGGFVICDDPGGIDLSFLGEPAHVRACTFAQFHAMFGMGSGESGGAGGEPPTGPQDPDALEPILYINTLAEADRNFAMAEEKEQMAQTKPMFGEFVLVRIAEVYLAGETLSLADLYGLMVDAETGLGLRLTYSKWGGPNQPPLDVFETPDGTGVEKNTRALFQQIDQLGMATPDPESWERHKAQMREIIGAFLAGTAAPTFERLFAGILTERVPGAEEYARHIRSRRAHLPFSRSGPSQWYVVADADPWQNDEARAITVDVETDQQGKVTRVIYNPAGTGKFYVGFGPWTELGMETELIRRSNGRFLHDHNGEPQFLEMASSDIFQNVNAQTFFEAFSDSGQHWPGAPALRIPNHGFDPNLPPDPETNPPDWEAFVLTTEHGPSGEVVRVNYSNGVATYDEAGQYYLLFDERTDTDGLFALITSEGEMLEETPGDWETRVLIGASAVQGITLAPEQFTNIFGIDVPNPGYDPAGAPYYDDINENGQPDTGEPSFAERHMLSDPNDWRSTWVEKYYRVQGTDAFPEPQEIDWEAETPALMDGTPLVPRNIRPRLNAFLFGRPNSAINLLMAFGSPEFFNGTQAMNAQTRINPLMAVALIDLVCERIQNVAATVDWDGPGGMPAHEELVPAWFFMAPIGDPLTMIIDRFDELAENTTE